MICFLTLVGGVFLVCYFLKKKPSENENDIFTFTSMHHGWAPFRNRHKWSKGERLGVRVELLKIKRAHLNSPRSACRVTDMEHASERFSQRPVQSTTQSTVIKPRWNMAGKVLSGVVAREEMKVNVGKSQFPAIWCAFKEKWGRVGETIESITHFSWLSQRWGRDPPGGGETKKACERANNEVC